MVRNAKVNPVEPDDFSVDRVRHWQRPGRVQSLCEATRKGRRHVQDNEHRRLEVARQAGDQPRDGVYAAGGSANYYDIAMFHSHQWRSRVRTVPIGSKLLSCRRTRAQQSTSAHDPTDTANSGTRLM